MSRFVKQRIIIGLSGGVDSAVAAHILKKQGHTVVGVFMKNWDELSERQCSGEKDSSDAEKVK